MSGCGAIEHLRLVGRIDRADRDAVNTFREQIVDHALLFGGRAVGWNPELDFNAGNVRGGLFGSFAGDDPEVRRVVGNKGELVFAAALPPGLWARVAA